MLPTEDLFVYVYVLIDDLVAARIIAIPCRPGAAPACSDAEPLAIAQVRHLLGRRSEAGFLAEVARDWAHLFPHLPHQSETNRRIRWLWGAFEQLRCHLALQVPADDCRERIVAACEEERRLIRRDPHDGLGPELAGMALQLAAWLFTCRPTTTWPNVPSGCVTGRSTPSQRCAASSRAWARALLTSWVSRRLFASSERQEPIRGFLCTFRPLLAISRPSRAEVAVVPPTPEIAAGLSARSPGLEHRPPRWRRRR
jgi:hypothetical protein